MKGMSDVCIFAGAWNRGAGFHHSLPDGPSARLPGVQDCCGIKNWAAAANLCCIPSLVGNRGILE